MNDIYQQVNRSILIVEDDAELGELLVQILLEKDYHSIVFRDPNLALRAAVALKPLLFLLDYHLPFTNGVTLYDQLHAIDGLSHVPAIILTADYRRRESEFQQRELLVVDKPFDLDKFLSCVEQVISSVKSV
jgi:DNA-binding response OmpR family regulator